jgi:hypothetical protein
MRKTAFLLAVIMAATAPTMALAAKKKAKVAPKPAVYDTTADNQMESSGRFLKAAFWNLVLKQDAPK